MGIVELFNTHYRIQNQTLFLAFSMCVSNKWHFKLVCNKAYIIILKRHILEIEFAAPGSRSH